MRDLSFHIQILQQHGICSPTLRSSNRKPIKQQYYNKDKVKEVEDSKRHPGRGVESWSKVKEDAAVPEMAPCKDAKRNIGIIEWDDVYS